MSLDKILEAIQLACQTEIAEIETRAQNQVDIILDNGQAEARRIQTERWNSAMDQAYQQETRILLEARSQVRKTLCEANQLVIGEILERSSEKLADLRVSPIYPAVLRHLLAEALDELYLCLEKGELVSLHADRRDQELIDPLLADEFPGVQLVYDLTCWGGVTAQSRDGCIVVINTLEERFERCKPHLQRHLTGWLESQRNVQA